MALGSCRLIGKVTLNGSPIAATITAVPRLPGPKPSASLSAPTTKTITVPGTGIIPSAPALDVPGGAGTWPSRGVEYDLTIAVAGQPSQTKRVFVDLGDTEMDISSVVFTSGRVDNVSITDFGASTVRANNAQAIQAAIDAVGSAGGGTVRIPRGLWATGPLKLRTRVKLVGEGWVSQLRLVNGSNTHLISLADSDTEQTAIEHLSLDGNGANQTAGDVVLLDNTDFDPPVTWPGLGDPYHTLTDVVIVNGKRDGLHTMGSLGAGTYDSVVVRNCDRYGINLQSPDNLLTRCTVFGSGLQNFMVQGNSNRIHSAKAYLAGRIDAANGDGFSCLGYNRLDLIGCEAQDNRRHGFAIGGGTQHNLSGCRADRNGMGADSTGYQGDGLSMGNVTNSRIDLVSGDRNSGGMKQRWTYNLYGTNSGLLVTIVAGTGADASKAGNGSFGPTSTGYVRWNGADAVGAFA